MRDILTTSEDRWALVRCAIVVGGVVLLLVMMAYPARASIGDNDDRRIERSYQKPIPKATKKVKKAPVLLAKSRVAKNPVAVKTTMLPHPPGCPATRFCGCGASIEVFGKSIRSLWLSTAWYRFPKAAPAPNRVAVRKGHVFVLKEHIRGDIWLAADYNSGGHKSRLHPRSIARYTIVDPHPRLARI